MERTYAPKYRLRTLREVNRNYVFQKGSSKKSESTREELKKGI